MQVAPCKWLRFFHPHVQRSPLLQPTVKDLIRAAVALNLKSKSRTKAKSGR
jgi:hypothetical protein